MSEEKETVQEEKAVTEKAAQATPKTERDILCDNLQGILDEVRDGAEKRFRMKKLEDLMVMGARCSKTLSSAEEEIGKHPEWTEEKLLLGKAYLAAAVLAYCATDSTAAKEKMEKAMAFIPKGTADWEQAMRIRKGLGLDGFSFIGWILPLAGFFIGVWAIMEYGPVNGLLVMGALVLLALIFVKYVVKPDIFKLYLGKK